VIKSDGLAWCVGRNQFSKLTHDGGTANVLAPAVQFDADTARTISLGDSFACFVSCTTGATRCAGEGNYGQLGDGQATDSTTALVIATGLDSDVCQILK
jgi:hypothetical protein